MRLIDLDATESYLLDGRYVVDPVKHGYWEIVDETEPRRYGCSVCMRMTYTKYNYCPHCGAKMEEVEE